MSNRAVERVSAAIVQVGEIIVEAINLVKWGGVDVAPAAAKDDASPNGLVVPEIGSRIQGYNSPTPGLGASWDRVRVGITSITSTFLGFVDTIPYGKFNEAPLVLVDGQGAPLQLDENGNLKITGSIITTPQVVGTQGNAWNAALTGVNGVSASIDCQFTPFVSVFGNVNGATTITMQYSQDNLSFYDAVTITLVAASDLEMSRNVGARYVRLKSSADVTATITVAAKE